MTTRPTEPPRQEPGTFSGEESHGADTYHRFATTGRCTRCGEWIAPWEGERHWGLCGPCGDHPEAIEQRLLLLRFTADDPAYWLDLEAEARVSLTDLDRLLRQTWLDCPPPCRHRSLFELWGVGYPIEVGEEPALGGKSGRPIRRLETDQPLGERLRPGVGLDYLYDFDAPTRLRGRVLAERRGRSAQRLAVVARNLRPRWTCALCDRDARQICARCQGRRPALFCDQHTETHGCGPEALRPILDSPRMGRCRFGR